METNFFSLGRPDTTKRLCSNNTPFAPQPFPLFFVFNPTLTMFSSLSFTLFPSLNCIVHFLPYSLHTFREDPNAKTNRSLTLVSPPFKMLHPFIVPSVHPRIRYRCSILPFFSRSTLSSFFTLIFILHHSSPPISFLVFARVRYARS